MGRRVAEQGLFHVQHRPGSRRADKKMLRTLKNEVPPEMGDTQNIHAVLCESKFRTGRHRGMGPLGAAMRGARTRSGAGVDDD
jgi:hypothetical protein